MAITPLPAAPETTDTPQQFNSKAFAWVQSLDTFVTEANAQAVDVNADAVLAEEWASKVTGNVDSTDYSAKAWAIGGTGVTDTASRGAAKEWAIETASTVDGTDYSAKEYAIGTQIRGSVGSSKDWAIYTAGTVDGTNYSAKYWADAASNSASAAATSAAAAQASANVTEWSGASSYSAGDNVYSPIDFFTYRNKTGSNSTDPSGDSTNWELISGNVVDDASQTLTNKTISGASNTLTVDGTDQVGFRNVPVISKSEAYTLVLSDSGKTILHPIGDNTARTFTIPANSSVAYPIGTAITFVNLINTVTIAITSDTMYLGNDGATGSRTLDPYGVATAIKVASTTWIISGNGLS